MTSQERGPVTFKFIGRQADGVKHMQRGRKILGMLKENLYEGANLNQGKFQIEFEETPGAPRTVITAYTWDDRDLVVIDTALISFEREEERAEDYFPDMWVGCRIDSMVTEFSTAKGAPFCEPRIPPALLMYMWEPPGSAAETAVERATLASGAQGLTTQVCGRHALASVAVDRSHGSYPIGNTWSCPTPAHATTGDTSVQTILALDLWENPEDGYTPIQDGKFTLPEGCASFSGAPGDCFICFNVNEGLDTVVPLTNGPVFFTDPESGDEFWAGQFLAGSPTAYFTDHGLYHLSGSFAWDSKFAPDADPDSIPDDNLWEQCFILDPDDQPNTFETARPYSTFAGRFPGGFPIEDPPTDWSFPGQVQSGKYALKICLIHESCCGFAEPNIFLTSSVAGFVASCTVEIRLGKPFGFSATAGGVVPGRQLTVRGKFLINGSGSFFRSITPYGFYGLFGASEDLRSDATDNNTTNGPCNPNSEENWFRDGMLIDVQGGSVTREGEYWLEDSDEYAYNTWPGYTDIPFDLSAQVLDCGNGIICIPPPLDCDNPSAPCNEFLYNIGQGGPGLTSVYPEHVIHMTGVVLCIDPNTVRFKGQPNPWKEDPLDPTSASIPRPVRIQVINTCIAAGSECEPLGNGVIYWVDVNTPDVGKPFALGEVVYIVAVPRPGPGQSSGGHVVIEKVSSSSPNQNGKLFNESNLICPGTIGKETLYRKIGFDEVVCTHSVEHIKVFRGVATKNQD